VSANPTFPVVVRTPNGDEVTLTGDEVSAEILIVDVYGNPAVLQVGSDRVRLRDGSDLVLSLVSP
jgi:hypothetical protein